MGFLFCETEFVILHLSHSHSIYKENINTIKQKGKSKLVKGKKSNKPGYKKAIVTLKKGQSIDLSTGI